MTTRQVAATMLMVHEESSQAYSFECGVLWQQQKQFCINEDELPDDYPYDEMYPFSWVDFVRYFPSKEFARGYMACLNAKEV